MKFIQPQPPLPPGGGPLTGFLQQLGRYIQNEFIKRPPEGVAVSSVILVSPNGSVYAVAVDNAGTITTTLLS